METIINFGIPHIAEEIFRNLTIPTLIQCRSVSATWKELVKNVLDSKWRETLIYSCKVGNTEMVQLMIETAKAKNQDWTLETSKENGLTLAMLACQKGQTEVVKLLMNQNLNWNMKDPYGKTAFMFASSNNHLVIIQLILHQAQNKSIDWNAKDLSGRTAFMWACFNGQKQVVETILKHSNFHEINLNDQDFIGRTPFMLACHNGQTDVVQLLINYLRIRRSRRRRRSVNLRIKENIQIMVNMKDHFGRTAMNLARGNGHIDVEMLLLKLCE